MKRFWQAVSLLLFIGGLTACQRATPVIPETVALIEESPVREISLGGPAARSKAEISGMAWCGDHLILLPQYPMMYQDENEPGYVFSIPRSTLEATLSGDGDEAILPEMLPFDHKGIGSKISGFEGFESVIFYQDNFYLTIEARQRGGMQGYLLKGIVDGDCERLVVLTEKPVKISPQADLGNMSDETLVIYEGQLLTIYEANGVNVNPNPLAHRFGLSLEPLGKLPMPNVEYRITDATEVDQQGEFWAINFFFPGDAKLEPGWDQIAVNYGLGRSHQGRDQVERLIALRIEGDRIILSKKSPIYLTLTGVLSRNWEGVVRYGKGFLLVTDKSPTTILAFVENILEH